MPEKTEIRNSLPEKLEPAHMRCLFDEAFSVGSEIVLPLGSGKGAGVGVVSRVRLDGGSYSYYSRWLRIESYSISVIVAGQIRFEDDNGRQEVFLPGQLFQRLPSQLHRTTIVHSQPLDEITIFVSQPVCHHLEQLGIIDERLTGSALDGQGARRLALLLSETRAIEGKFSKPLSALIKLLNLLQPLHSPSAVMQTKEERMEKGRELLSNDLQRALSCRIIAQSVGMSESDFRKTFGHHHDCSPNQFRQARRMQHARDLLFAGLSVAEAAEKLGYSDPFAFSKAFKLHFGMAPREMIKK